MYVTTARIEKIAHKLVGRGVFDELQMEMLPAKVIEDVLSEEGWSIICDENGVVLDEDTKGEIRSETSQKCARTLQSMLQDC